MADDVASLGLSIEYDSVERATDALEGLTNEADKAGGATKRVGDESKKASGSVSGLGGALRMASIAVAAFGVSMSVGALGRMADTWSDLAARVDIATGNIGIAGETMQRLQQIARGTYSSLELTAEGFIYNNSVLSQLGYSVGQTLDYVTALNNALVVSGARGERAARVQDALSRAMALGRLSGDQLNAVIESGGRIAEVLAEELGVTTLELRRLGSEGRITGDIIYNSLTKRMEELEEQAENMPATIEDAFTIMGNSVLALVGQLDQATGASGNFATMLIAVGDAITSATGPLTRIVSIVGDALGSAFDALGPVIGIATSALAGFFAPVVIAGLGTVSVAIGTTMVGAVRALTAAMLANPMGLLIAGISAAVTAAFMFRDEIKQVIGFDVVEVFRTVGNAIIGIFVGVWRVLASTAGATWEAITTSASAVPVGLKAVWGTVQAGFFEMLAAMQERWANFLHNMSATIRNIPFMEDVGLEVSGAAVRAGSAFYELSAAAETARNSAAGLAEEASGLVTSGLSGLGHVAQQIGQILGESLSEDHIGAIGEALGEVWGNAEGAAGALNDLVGALDGNVSGGGAAGGGGASAATENLISELQTQLDALREHFMSEEELLTQRYAKNMELLTAAREAELISMQEHNALKLNIEREYGAQLAQIQAQQYTGALNAAGDFFGALAGVMGGENETMLKMQRTFAAASALINAWLAASQVLADPTIPFWGKFAAVASVVTAGLGMVNAIKSGSSSASGRGGGGSSSSAPSAAPAQQPQPTRQAVEINVQGEVFTKETVLSIMDKINDLSSDGHMLVVTGR